MPFDAVAVRALACARIVLLDPFREIIEPVIERTFDLRSRWPRCLGPHPGPVRGDYFLGLVGFE